MLGMIASNTDPSVWCISFVIGMITRMESGSFGRCFWKLSSVCMCVWAWTAVTGCFEGDWRVAVSSAKGLKYGDHTLTLLGLLVSISLH